LSLVPYALESRDLIRRILDDTKAEGRCDLSWHRLEQLKALFRSTRAETEALT
jgi:hypothetical protein